MSGRIAFFLSGLLLLPVMAVAQTGPQCSQAPGSIACYSPAQNLQSTDILGGMQATGPQRSPQSVRVTPAQIVAAGGGAGLTLTDGTHTVTPTTQLTVAGGVISGTTPNATLTISAAAASITPGTTVALGTSAPCAIYNPSGTVISCQLIPLGSGVSGVLPVSFGGTGTPSPGLIAGTNVTISGSWPNQTINSSGGGGGGSTLTFGTHLTGGSYNGSAPITLGTDATSANTASTIVARDGSGNFSSGTITAALTGNATTATTATAANAINSATSTVVVNGAAAPTNGQVLTASSSTAASWVSPPGGGNVSNVGTPTNGQLAQWTGATTIQGINANAGALTALASALNGSGGLLAFSLIGTSGATIPLLNANNTWSGTQSFNDGDLILKGSSSGTSVIHAPATSGGSVTLPQTTTANLAYQVGSLVGGHCLQASGTAGGIADSGSACGGGGGAVSITAGTADIVVAPNPITGTGTISTTTPLIQSATSPYIYNGTGTSGTGAQVDNVYLIELSAASAAMTLPQAGTTGFAAGVGSMVVPTGTGTTTVTPTTSTIAGLTAITLAPHQFLSFGSDGTNYEAALGMPPSGTQNLVIATPNGSTGQPNLRALVAGDLPSLGANPTATAGAAAVNGSATTYMRSDGAPALQVASGATKGIVAGDSSTLTNTSGVLSCTVMSTSQSGCAKVDGSTITISGGIISSVGGSATSIVPGTTTIGGATAPCLIENSTSTTMACPGVGANVVTAFGNALSAAGGLTTTVASGTSAMGTGAISSASCATVVTTTATNTATTDVVAWGFNGDPTGVTGYTPVTTGALTIFAYPSANNVNFKVCNLTGSSITPGAITLNWRVAR